MEVRLIQGDGITPQTLKIILENLEAAGYSASNIAFGMGGGLLQLVNRDTYKFAMKCSAAEVDGQWIDVFKQPVGDTSKKSKRGRITLATTSYSNTPATIQIDALNDCIGCEDLMHTVYENGPVAEAYEEFAAIRERANTSIV